MSQTQVVSKQRVADHGEVYTHPREVNAMLDLVKHETERIESRFLEPACGTGNFLVEILSRKLAVVESRYKTSQFEFERYAVIAVSSIYGIDILVDNVNKCQQRLFGVFEAVYERLYKGKCKEECLRSIGFVLSRNILHGNALPKDAISLKADVTNAKPFEELIFSKWTMTGSLLQQEDFTYEHLVKFSAPPPPDDLFSPENINRTIQSNANLDKSDEGVYSYEITPVAKHLSVHFLKIGAEVKHV